MYHHHLKKSSQQLLNYLIFRQLNQRYQIIFFHIQRNFFVRNMLKSNLNNKNSTAKNNISKYFNPSILIQPKRHNKSNIVSNIHCRSMQQLDLNHNLLSQPSTKNQDKKSIIHHSSLFNEKQNSYLSNEPTKSKSLSKFIALFQNSNILNTKNQSNDTRNDQKGTSKRKNYNGFSYDLKISANSNVGNQKINKNKQKESTIGDQNTGNRSHRQLLSSLTGNRSTIVVKKNQENQNQSASQEPLLRKMKQIIEQQKKRQKKYIQKIQSQQKQYQAKIQQTFQQCQNQKSNYQNKLQNYSHKQSQLEKKIQELNNLIEKKSKDYQMKIKNYQDKIKVLTMRQQQSANNGNSNSHKQCKQHDLVIKSLKKVINQQLNKIIDLEKYKIQNQYLHSIINSHRNNDMNGNSEHEKQSFCQEENSFNQYEQSGSYQNSKRKFSQKNDLIYFDNNSNKNKFGKREEQISPQFSLNQEDSQDSSNHQNSKPMPNFNKKPQKNHNKASNQTQNHFHSTNQQFFYFNDNSSDKKSKSIQRSKANLINISQQIKNRMNNSKQGASINILKNPSNKDPNHKPSYLDGQNLNMIKIKQAQSSFSRDAIQQVTQQNEQFQQKQNIQHLFINDHNQSSKLDNIREEQDSILEQVDQYLSKWRNTSNRHS